MAKNIHTVRVFNYRLDGYGHINNARYLEFLEEARWMFFREHGLREALRELDLVVSQINIRYRSAAVLDDELNIVSQIVDVQSRQLTMRQKVFRVGETRVLVEAEVMLVPTQQAAKIVRLPDELAKTLKDLLESNSEI